MLEVGVGTAHFARWFETFGIQCVGLDLSLPMLREAKRLWKGAVIRGDAHHLPFREKTFDLVTFITCMEFVRNPIGVLREASIVSRNGIVCGMLNKWSLPALQRKFQVMLGKNPFYRNARFYSIKDAKCLVRKALHEINYEMKWSTTIHPRLALSKSSKIPIGAFLAVAVKFSNSKGLAMPEAGKFFPTPLLYDVIRGFCPTQSDTYPTQPRCAG